MLISAVSAFLLIPYLAMRATMTMVVVLGILGLTTSMMAVWEDVALRAVAQLRTNRWTE